MKFVAKTENDFHAISEKFLPLLKENKIFAFFGEMGVGKTTFISYLAKTMKIEDVVSSPTFGYVNEYQSAKYGKVYHFDFYRITSEEEAFDIGIEEYIYGNHIVFIEWPEKIENLLPDNYVWISITKNSDEERFIEIKP